LRNKNNSNPLAFEDHLHVRFNAAALIALESLILSASVIYFVYFDILLQRDEYFTIAFVSSVPWQWAPRTLRRRILSVIEMLVQETVHIERFMRMLHCKLRFQVERAFALSVQEHSGIVAHRIVSAAACNSANGKTRKASLRGIAPT
jgi:hypothetical protein